MDGLYCFSPKNLLQKQEEDLIDFLFPSKKDLDPSRIVEVSLYRKYLDQSTTFIYFKNNKIIGTIRCIWKMSDLDSLPIEASHVTDVKDSTYGFREGFQYSAPNPPCSEIGGLKISENAAFRERSQILRTLFEACSKECFKINCTLAYVTCDPVLTRLYSNRYLFFEMATVTYDFKNHWIALVKNICLLR